MRTHRKGLIVVALGAAMILAGCSTDGSVDPSAAPEGSEAPPAESEYSSGQWFDQPGKDEQFEQRSPRIEGDPATPCLH